MICLRRTCAATLMIGTVLAAASGTAATADPGGNCCQDLEERIAELEATTARKGNRKVSLTISGAVAQAVLFWDDGGESNVHVVTNENYRSRFAFKGKAKVNSDIEAGYALEIGVRTANSKRFTQDNARLTASTDVGLDLRDSYWFLKSKSLGQVSVGNHGAATNGISEINQTQTAFFSKYSDVEDSGLGLFLRSAASGGLSTLSWRRLLGDGGDQPGDGERALNIVKYETPALQGLTASASWGEDDMWDAALRYTGEFSGFKLAAGIGYGEVLDNDQTASVCAASLPAGHPEGSDVRCGQIGASVSVLHEPTGLFVNAAAGTKDDDLLSKAARFNGTGAGDGQDFYAVQGGIEKKFNALGKTTIYGEYYNYDGGASTRRTIAATDAINPIPGTTAAIWSSGLEAYGGGIAQGIDAASMILYFSYRHYEADLAARAIAGGVASGAIADADLEDLDVVLGGGIIRF